MNAEPAINLGALPESSSSTSADDIDDHRQITQLKPTDRGPDAWRLLIAAFIFEALFWGNHRPSMPKIELILMLLTQASQPHTVSSKITTPPNHSLQPIRPKSQSSVPWLKACTIWVRRSLQPSRSDIPSIRRPKYCVDGLCVLSGYSLRRSSTPYLV